jgi:hypothetical protein
MVFWPTPAMLSSDFHPELLLMFYPFPEFSTLNLSNYLKLLIVEVMPKSIQLHKSVTILDAATKQSALFPSLFCNAEVKPQQAANHLLREFICAPICLLWP